MDMRVYLQEIHRLEVCFRERQDQLAELKAAILKASNPAKERVSGGKAAPDDQVVNLVDRLIRLQRETERIIAEYWDAKCRIIGKIQRLPNVRQVELLYKRYVETKDLRTIADEMCLSEERVRHLHGEALRAMEKMLEGASEREKPEQA